MTDLRKYARVERERRFLVAAIADGVVDSRRIEDHYLVGTRLRLREVTAADGTVVRKLNHKVRMTDGPAEIACTSCYLDEEEWRILRQLASRRLTKVRHLIVRDGRAIAVDELADHTLLAEVDDGDGAPLPVPVWLDVIADVSSDEAWTGAALARREAAPDDAP